MRETEDFRDLFMSFDGLLFFGEIGDGDLVGFRVLRGVTPDDVYLWDHENDSRVWIARSLEAYLRRQIRGGLSDSPDPQPR